MAQQSLYVGKSKIGQVHIGRLRLCSSRILDLFMQFAYSACYHVVDCLCETRSFQILSAGSLASAKRDPLKFFPVDHDLFPRLIPLIVINT